MLNIEMCRQWYGAGAEPWAALARSWAERHDPRRVTSVGARIATASLPLLARIAATCLERPFPAFGDRPITALADPQLVSPAALDALAARAGPTLLTSPYLARQRPLQIVAFLSRQQPRDPAAAAEATRRLHAWLATLAPIPLPRAA
jgi:hypothetical protein